MKDTWKSESLLLGQTSVMHITISSAHAPKTFMYQFQVPYVRLQGFAPLTLSRLQPRIYLKKASAHQSPLSFCFQDQLQTNATSWHVVFSAHILQTGKKQLSETYCIWPEHWFAWAFNGSVRELEGRCQVRLVLHCSNGSDLVYLFR